MSKRELKMSNSHVTMILHQFFKLFGKVLGIMVGCVLTEGQMTEKYCLTLQLSMPPKARVSKNGKFSQKNLLCDSA